MVKALGNDASWYTRTWVRCAAVTIRPSEKQYIANETLGFAAASFEVMLIPFALGNLLRGLRGLPTVLLTFEYVMCCTTRRSTGGCTTLAALPSSVMPISLSVVILRRCSTECTEGFTFVCFVHITDVD